MSDETLKLPPLQQTPLDPATRDALFRDLAACVQLRSVVARAPGAARNAVPDSLTLEAARAGLASGALRSVQIRYGYENSEWCDTLMSSPTGLRLVRICENDIAASVAPAVPTAPTATA